VEVWQTSNLRPLRLGEEKKKEEERRNHRMKYRADHNDSNTRMRPKQIHIVGPCWEHFVATHFMAM